MKHIDTQNLYNFWNNLRNGRIAPYRSEIDPRTIASYLDSTFILELIGSDKMRFRLAGTRLCEAYGMELRGMSAYSLWQGECRDTIRALTMDVIKKPSVGHASCTVETASGMLHNAEFLFMPLRSDFGDIDRILGCAFYTTSAQKNIVDLSQMHHWVDSTHTIPIDVQIVDNAIRGSSGLPARRHTDVTSDSYTTTSKNGLQHFPSFKTIEGGIKGFRRSDLSTPDDNVHTSRSHLKLVKSDAG